jgi:hypothetical protein
MRFHSSLRCVLLLPLIAVAASTAGAQEPKAGVVVGYPADVGVFWQAAERVALRADVGFSSSRSEFSSEFGLGFGSLTPAVVTTTSSSSTTSIGLAALFTLRNEDNLRLYIAPGGAIQLVRHTIETEFASGSLPAGTFPVEGEASDTARGHQLQMMFGGQYRLRDRVAVFGETGLVYQTSEFPQLSASLSIPGATQTRSERNSRSTQTGVGGMAGLVLFF